jgi:hypothetical protein
LNLFYNQEDKVTEREDYYLNSVMPVVLCKIKKENLVIQNSRRILDTSNMPIVSWEDIEETQFDSQIWTTSFNRGTYYCGKYCEKTSDVRPLYQFSFWLNNTIGEKEFTIMTLDM